jgi:hypothetical protein
MRRIKFKIILVLFVAETTADSFINPTLYYRDYGVAIFSVGWRCESVYG